MGDFRSKFPKTNTILTSVKSFFDVNEIGKKDAEFSCASFDPYKVFWRISTYLNAHTNAKKCFFDCQFPGKRSEFSIISNDFFII